MDTMSRKVAPGSFEAELLLALQTRRLAKTKYWIFSDRASRATIDHINPLCHAKNNTASAMRCTAQMIRDVLFALLFNFKLRT
jgi:hypothetical protein